MSFTIDKQTIDDLNIFGKTGQKSIFNIYNNTKTYGGTLVLKDIFSYPLGDYKRIKDRSTTIDFFAKSDLSFDFETDLFNIVEEYLENNDSRTKLNKKESYFRRCINSVTGAKAAYQNIKTGVLSTIKIVEQISLFLSHNKLNSVKSHFQELIAIENLLHDEDIKWIEKIKHKNRLSYKQIVELDERLRFNSSEKILRLLKYLYYIDVYISIAKVTKERNFVSAEVINTTENILEINNFYHPYVPKAIANSISLDSNQNIVFLTGANMAGKSTFMKSFGIIVYLAHLGLPLPASSMRFSVKSGLYTTINLPDNINMGYSHFYADVLRVKKVAEHVSRQSNIVVIFDELFRGTNVKDAHDATIAVTEAFSLNPRCTFMMSTHIIEAATELKKQCSNIKYIYLPTKIENGSPRYTYTIEEGVTADRHGMIIIRNESIIELLQNGAKRIEQKKQN